MQTYCSEIGLGLPLREKYYSLDDNDFKLLRFIESKQKNYGFVPLDIIENKSKINPSYLRNSIKKLLDLDLILSESYPFYGYQLMYHGLDILSLRYYFKRNIITDVGDRINTGKESDIYLAITSANNKAVIKFHREGRISFKSVVRKREYEIKQKKLWLLIAEKIAKREYDILNGIWKNDGLVPEPIAHNRHSLIMNKIEGVELYKVKQIDNKTLLNIFNDIINTLKVAYNKVKIVHGDLNQYNVLISSEENPRGYIIDWPQSIGVDSENAEYKLKKDVEYLASYLYKKFGTEIDIDKTLVYIKGGIDGFR
ncbi:MAG: hypothetical protein C0171_01725 [Caldisphaera sp.]|jgi:RIO kinase 2|nr:MAG: hypothetical protein C0201_01015 [Caldisphaera sp.]PMP92003.1 MAG: hypothetical protein C0171_01725 [Caldisphaera sp.]